MADLRTSTERGSDYRLRLMIGAHAVWITFVCLLVAWWGRLVLIQAKRIGHLESKMGLVFPAGESHWQRTERMLYWEGGTFLVLLVASTALLFWLFWRDTKRAQGIQAFFASVSHELRTPLTGIRLQAESIAEKDALKSELVKRLLEDTVRLENQVERTLELARLEGGGPVYARSLPLKQWVNRFVAQWETLGHSPGQVTFDVDVDPVQVQGDPNAMQVIFKNLIENSLRHGGKENLTISVRSDRDKLVVRDNGQGYLGNQRVLGQVFQKGPSSQGTGVGLYLVRTLMKKMDGMAEFSTVQGKGFEVVLKFKEAAPDA